RIKQNRTEAAMLRSDMLHVEAVLKMLEPGFSVRSIAARRKNNPNPLLKRGTIFRAVLDVLRAAPAPMTVDGFQRRCSHPRACLRRRVPTCAACSERSEHLGKSVEGDDGRPRRWRILSA